MFFNSFQVFYKVEKQTHKLELLTRFKIHNIFPISLFKQDIEKKRQVNKLFKSKLGLDVKNNKEYEDKIIKDNAIYVNKTTRRQLL